MAARPGRAISGFQAATSHTPGPVSSSPSKNLVTWARVRAMTGADAPS
jgi:hypothetical protein